MIRKRRCFYGRDLYPQENKCFATVWNILYYSVCLLRVVEPEAASELDNTFLLLGIVFGSFAIPSMMLNYGAYIHIEGNTIKAKYHWFGRLDCNIDEVEFVLPQVNTLTILLKNGKRHTIMVVENSWALSAVIRRKSFEIEKETPDSLRQKLSQEQAARKKEIWWVSGVGVLLFVNTLVAALLTGFRDMNEFSRLDWILFSVMGAIELLTLIGLFYIAQRCGKHLLPIEQLKYRLRGAVIAAHPLPTNNTTAVYTDENRTGRIVVCGYPNDDSAYCYVQTIVGDFELETAYESAVYENAEELWIEEFSKEEFSALFDITPFMITQ